MALTQNQGRAHFLRLELDAWRWGHPRAKKKNEPKGQAKGRLWDSLPTNLWQPLGQELSFWYATEDALQQSIKRHHPEQAMHGRRRQSAEDFGKLIQDEIAAKYKDLINTAPQLIDARSAVGQESAAVAYLRDRRDELIRRRGDIRKILENLEKQAMTPEEAARAKIARSGKLKSREGWVWIKSLGAGSGGDALLYVRQDSSGAIVDRIAAKELSTKKAHPSALNKKTKFPHEITAMLSLRPLIGSDRIVKLIRWNQGRLPHIFRIYMEFCNYGDLFSLICNYSPLSDEDGNILKERDFIPEPFIWKMFEDLVIAGILMERGDLEPTTKRWSVIVHRDWRSQNVFLGKNTSGIYKGYPTSKTGDFGWCAIMPTSGEKHPGWRFYASPPPWEHWPPEQNHDTGDRLSSLTNVWSCGHVIQSAISLNHSDRGYISRGYTTPSDFADDVKEYYSSDLLDLVLSCLAESPSDRPSFDKLLRKIRRRTGEGANDLAQGLRTADEGHKGFSDHALLGIQDKWPLKSMLSGKLPEDRTIPDPPDEDKTRESSEESSEPSDSESDSESDDDGGAGAAGGAGGAGGDGAGGDDGGRADDGGRRGSGSREPSAAAGAESSRTPRPTLGGEGLSPPQQQPKEPTITLKQARRRSREMEETEGPPEPARKKMKIRLGKKMG